jgi:hypothetical protein
MKRPFHPMLAVAASVALLARPARAHDGPPYPILVDEPLAGRVISIWADPDVGVGTFYIYVDGENARERCRLDIGVTPADEHQGEQVFAAVPAEPGEPFQLFGEVDFDRVGEWEVRFVLEATDGKAELRLPVDVTPPGLGRIDFIWYLSPFAAVAFLWVKVFLKRRENARESLPC